MYKSVLPRLKYYVLKTRSHRSYTQVFMVPTDSLPASVKGRVNTKTHNHLIVFLVVKGLVKNFVAKIEGVKSTHFSTLGETLPQL